MPPRLQWALLFLLLALMGGYLILIGGNGPCGHPGDYMRRDCQYSTAKRG
jgi:hypothetical protein